MNLRVLRADALLFLTAIIWGAAFVAQRLGMDNIGPFTFNALRFALGGLVLIPLARYQFSRFTPPGDGGSTPNRMAYVKASVLAGLILFTASTLQQVGLLFTTAGKAGFITGLYVVIVPLLGLLWQERPDLGTWIGAALATIGLYFLSVTESWTMAWGDGLELVGALFWAVHVVLIGKFARQLEPVTFSAGQFFICAMASLAVAMFRESFAPASIAAAAIPILYGGLISVGIGYPLQVVAQKDAPAAHAAIILSLEAVFAAIAGRLILQETLPWRAVTGGLLMLAGTVLAQLWPVLFPTTPTVEAAISKNEGI